jgi:DNA primase
MAGERQIRFMFLPEGEDPDSLIRQEGSEAFERRVDSALPLSEFFFDTLLKTVDIGTIEGRNGLLEQAKPLIKRLPEGDYRRMMAARLGEIAHIDQSSLGGSAAPQTPSRQAHGMAPRAAAQGDSPVRRGIRFLLQQPALAGQVKDPEGLRGLELPGIGLFLQLIELLQANPHLTCGAIVEHWRGQDTGKHLSRLAQIPLLTPDEGLEMEFRGILDQLEHIRIQQEYERLSLKARNGALTDEEKRRYAQLVTVRRDGGAT